MYIDIYCNVLYPGTLVPGTPPSPYDLHGISFHAFIHRYSHPRMSLNMLCQFNQ